MKKDLPAKGSEWVRLILSGLVFLAFIPATILALPKVMELSDPQARLQFQQELQSLGIGGWLTFLGIQVLQVVVAMIPGEPVEILAGLLYGPLWGTLSCMLGILIGSLIVYFLVRRLGMPIVSIFMDPDKFQNLWLLKDERRFERISFLLWKRLLRIRKQRSHRHRGMQKTKMMLQKRMLRKLTQKKSLMLRKMYTKMVYTPVLHRDLEVRSPYRSHLQMMRSQIFR